MTPPYPADSGNVSGAFPSKAAAQKDRVGDKDWPIWKGPLPEINGRLEASLILPVPLSPYATVDIAETLRYLVTVQKFMGKRFPRNHEILLVAFGRRQPEMGLLLSRLTQATVGRKSFRWIAGIHTGTGAAVREAVFHSLGRKILVGSLEYLYDPSFFHDALAGLHPNLAGIRANRRLPDSEFTVPVTVLSMVYRRHLLGLAISRIWSRLFSLHLTDFLSGAYILRRKFALSVFSRITCPGFLYEAELAILAQANGRTIADIPARFFLEKEKPRLRVWGEVAGVLAWTIRLFGSVRRKEYEFLKLTGNHLTADDWGLSPGVNEGILALAKLGHLRRVSVLAGSPYLDYRLDDLKKIPGMEFGLHFNLTQLESGGSFKSPGRFLGAWLSRRRKGRKDMIRMVRKALTDQIQTMRKSGIRAVRLDGHHHVHAAPGLLEAVADILRREKIRFVRVPYHRSLWSGRRIPIAWLGLKLREAVQRLGLKTLPFYYPSRADFSNLNRLVKALNQNTGAEVLIHPAAWNDISRTAPSDPYRQERVVEFNLVRMLVFALKLYSR